MVEQLTVGPVHPWSQDRLISRGRVLCPCLGSAHGTARASGLVRCAVPRDRAQPALLPRVHADPGGAREGARDRRPGATVASSRPAPASAPPPPPKAPRPPP